MTSKTSRGSPAGMMLSGSTGIGRSGGLIYSPSISLPISMATRALMRMSSLSMVWPSSTRASSSLGHSRDYRAWVQHGAGP